MQNAFTVYFVCKNLSVYVCYIISSIVRHTVLFIYEKKDNDHKRDVAERVGTHSLFFYSNDDPSLVYYPFGFFKLLFQLPLPYMVEFDCVFKLWRLFSNSGARKPLLTYN